MKKFRVRALRQAKRWTQDRLSNESGVQIKTIANIEAERITEPRFATLEALASALNVSVDELFEEVEDTAAT